MITSRSMTIGLKFLFALLILVSISTAQASKHHIFLIHGIADNETAFGASNVVLYNLLNDSSSETQFFLESFEYQTGNDDLNTVDFAKSFSKFFKQYFSENLIEPDDKFSILAHSQGGLVTMNWLYHSFKGDEGFSDFKFIQKHMKTYISAATPYGGTEIITLALLFKRLRRYFKFGQKELRDMYFPSEMIGKMRSILLGEEPELLSFLNSLNILNIVGVSYGLPKFSSSAANLQDDTTVPVSSASMNFYYLKNHKVYFPGGDEKIEVNETKLHTNATVVPVRASHIPVLFVPGIVKIPIECRFLGDCDHPAINYYLNHFLERPLPPVEEKLRSFVIKLKLHVSKKSLDYTDSEPEFGIEFNSNTYRVSKALGKSFFLDDVKETETSRIYEYYYAGKLSKNKLREHITNIKINGPTSFHIPREADFKIAPGFETTIDLKLMSIGDY